MLSLEINDSNEDGWKMEGGNSLVKNLVIVANRRKFGRWMLSGNLLVIANMKQRLWQEMQV